MSSLLFVKHQSETSTYDSRDEIRAEWYDEKGRSHDQACNLESLTEVSRRSFTTRAQTVEYATSQCFLSRAAHERWERSAIPAVWSVSLLRTVSLSSAESLRTAGGQATVYGTIERAENKGVTHPSFRASIGPWYN